MNGWKCRAQKSFIAHFVLFCSAKTVKPDADCYPPLRPTRSNSHNWTICGRVSHDSITWLATSHGRKIAQGQLKIRPYGRTITLTSIQLKILFSFRKTRISEFSSSADFVL